MASRRTHHSDTMHNSNDIEMDPVNSRSNPHPSHQHHHHRRHRRKHEENWFRKNLNLKNCKRFVLDDPDHESKERRYHLCACGRRYDHHYPKEVLKEVEERTEIWNPEDDTQEFSTNAFGELKFTGHSNKTAKFARLSMDTPMDTVLELLNVQWNLSAPRFVLLVLGGENDSDKKQKVNELFSSGIMKACSSKFTKGWLISGGAYTGVMDSVRDAMVKQLASPTMIGVMPWGNVAGKHKLTDRRGKGRWPASHVIIPKAQKHDYSLDMNHSHFLLVDDGTIGKKVEGIHKFRMNFVTALQKHLGPRVPFVNVVFKGGLGAIETVAKSVKLSKKSDFNSPSVLVKHSGGAADILVFALENSKNSILGAECIQKLEQMVPEAFKERNVENIIELIKVCVSNKDLISVYDPTAMVGVDIELDRVILNAPIQAGAFGDFKKLKLALSWNRLDLAKDIFSKPDVDIKQRELQELSRRSLHLNRPKFFDLFHENCLDLSTFVTISRVEKLYSDAMRSTPAKRLLKYIRSDSQVIEIFVNMLEGVSNMCRCDDEAVQLPAAESPQDLIEYLDDDPKTEESSQKLVCKASDSGCYNLKDVGRLIRRLMGRFYHPIYFNPHIPVEEMIVDEITESDDVPEFDEPLRELFIWAILNDKPDSARSLWTKLKNPMAAALTAVKLFKAMAENTTFDGAMKQRFANLAEEFEERAVGVLDTCYQNEMDALLVGENYDEQRMDYLLLKEQKQFGDSTCLRLATKSDCENYVSHPVVQSLLDRIWRGKLSIENSWWRILICVLCPNPFIIYALLYFRDDETVDRKTDTLLSKHQRVSKKLDIYSLGRKLKFLERMYYFFTAPITVFSYNFFAYVCFLTLFSYILLSDYTVSTISNAEMVLIAWVGTFLTEELRQLAMAGVISYVDSFWNKFDISALLSFFISLGLRFFPSVAYEWPRYLLCVSLFLFYVRLLHIFSIFKRLGPLLLMIRKMIGDLLAFMVIIFVFTVAYGVVWHSILYPNSPMSVPLILSIIRASYWPMFGEVSKYLDEEIEVGSCTLNSTTGTLGSFCSSAQIIAPVMLGVYVLFVAVLMFNLLIALFSYRFEEMYPKANELWSFQRYFLIKEYHERPKAPPPFIIVFHVVEIVIRFLQFAVKYLCGCTNKCKKFIEYELPWNRQLQIVFKEHEMQIEKDLLSWECSNADIYNAKKYENEEDDMKLQLENLKYKIDELLRNNKDATGISSTAMDMINQWRRVAKLPCKQTFGGGRLDETARTTEMVTRLTDNAE